MKQGWEIRKLGEVCDIVNGSTPLRTNKDFWEGGDFPWFTIDDIREQGRTIRYTKQKITQSALKKLRILPINTILLCCTASIGEYAITEIELTTNQQFNGLVIKNKKELHPKFLLYFSSTLKETLSNLSGKTTIDFIPISRLKDIEIPLPSLPEQQRIVAILDEAFIAIAKAKANAEQNLKNSKELFDSYLQGVFENANWETKKLNEITEVKDGTHDSPKYIPEGIPFVTQKNIRQDGLSFADTKFITDTDHEKFYKRSNVTNGDILISMIGANRGMAAIVDDKRIFSIKNVGLIKESENINKQFLLYYLKSSLAMKYVLYMSNGGAQEFIGLTALRSFPIPYPPLKEQQVIVQKLNILSAETKKLEAIYNQKLNDLEELKKSVLQKAFSGELKTSKI